MLVGVTIGGSVLEDVFGFGPCLLDVSLGLLDASLGAQPGVAGGAAEVLLGGALNGFGLMGELLADAHVGFPSCCGDCKTDRGRVSPGVRCYRLIGFGATRLCRVARAGIVQHSDDSAITATAKTADLTDDDHGDASDSGAHLPVHS